MAGARVKETFFVPHGAPLLVTDDSFPARKFLQSFRDIVFTHKPTSILVVSTHWGTSESTINANSGSLETIYDFFGFPEELYKLKYPAKGAPELAKKVQELLLGSGLPKVNVDDQRGLDHGAWIPLMLMYPEADIPVCQLSIVPTMDATYHYNLGKALAPLKDQGVLIVCSGGATDTKSRRLGSKEVAPWAEEFDSWLEDALVAGRFEDVKQYKDKAPHVELAHPSPDHLYPLHVAMGAAGENARAQLIHRSWNAYTLKYPAKGAPELAKKVQELLLGSGLPKVNVDDKRGLDHGAWVPLMLMYPEANIPVCQLSIIPTMDAAYHYNLEKALAPLKDQGVLIVCSGGTTDPNTRRVGSKEVAPWAEEFDSWLEDALVAGRFEDVNQYKDKAPPHVELTHPSPTHLYPLHVAIGVAGENARAELIHRSWTGYTVSYASYKFTSSSAK